MIMVQLGEPLTYPLAALLREAPGATRFYPVAGVTIDLGPDLELADPIEGTVRVSRTNRGVIVNARLDTAIHADSAGQAVRRLESAIVAQPDVKGQP